MSMDDAQEPQKPTSSPSSPRPGTKPSAPSASHYVAELPYAEELQDLLEGRYLVESFLGQGGMGAVYRGLQLPLKRPVAIKILQKLATPDDFDFEERFKREAYAMAALTHPNIVQVYDCGDAGESFLFISMELVEGGDLSDAIKGGQCTPEVALTLIQQICDGLQAAHDRGLVHRDIKPANIFLTADGKAKVADFGLAKKFDVKSTFVTKTGLGMGTPDYAAPEQYEGVSDIDHRADIYALGVMFYQMLTGSLPRGMFKPASQRVAVDPRLDEVVNKAMQPERHERYQSVAEMKAEIQHIISTWFAAPQAQPAPVARTASQPALTHTGRVPTASRPGAPRATPAPAPAPAAEEKSRPGMLVAMVAVVAILAAGAFFILKKPAPVPDDAQTTVAAPARFEQTASAGALDGQRGTTSGALTVPQPASPPLSAVRQTLDLLALTDPVLDRVMSANIGGKNEWAREGTSLVYKSDGRAGKLAAPVAFNCRDYEIELRAERLSGAERIHLDLPLTDGSILPLILNSPNRKVIHEREGNAWGPAGSLVHISVRVTKGTSGQSGRIVLQRKDTGTTLADWSGSFESLARLGEGHPAFPRQSLASVFLRDAPYVIKTWTLRVFDGEATVLRGSADTPSRPSLVYGGHRYRMLPDILTWTAAKAKAESMGGHLATITSKEENDWIEQNFIAGLPQGLGLWIGGTHDGTPGKWRWITGEQFAFTDWASGEPNNRPEELGLSFSFSDQKAMGWFDIKDNGRGMKERRAGILVEWDTAAPPGGSAPAAVDGQSSGTVNLLEGFDEVRDAIEGRWLMKDGELHAVHGGGFARVAFGAAVPAEYDFRIRFTRVSGPNAVVQHIVLPDGQDVLWLMGGFGNKFCAWERVNGKIGNENPSTINRGIENGRRYECLVRVRKDRLQVELDGELISDHAIGNNKLDVVDKWRFPDPRKLGVGCQQPTVFHSVELISYSDQPLAAAPAMPGAPAPVTSVPPALSAPSDPRLAQLETGFKARYEAEVEKPYLAALAVLNQSYVANGISRARAAAQGRGSLEEVTLLDAEAKRIQDNEGVPSTDADSLPEAVKQLRNTYRTALAKIEADRAQKAGPLYDLYLGALDTYVTELTKGDKIDQARQVRTLRDQISAQKGIITGDASAAPSRPASAGAGETPSPMGPTATASPTSMGAATPVPPELLAAPEKATHTKELVDWLKKRPSHRIGFIHGGKRSQVSQDRRGEVPNGADLFLIDNGGQGRDASFEASWLEGQTDLEEIHLFALDRFSSPRVFRGMKSLRYLRLQSPRSALTDELMQQWPPLPALTNLEVDAGCSEVGFRILCERCPQLSRLTVRSVRLAEGGLAPLQLLRNLTFYQHGGADLPRSGFSTLASLPKLDTVELRDADLTGADFSALVNLTSLTFYNTKIGDAEVQTLGNLKKLTRLNLAINRVTDASLPVLGTMTKLETIDLGNNNIAGSSLTALEGLKGLAGLRLAQSPVNDAGLATLPTFPVLLRLTLNDCPSIGDGAVPAMIRQRALTELNLGKTGITDKGVLAVCEALPDLTVLWLNGTKVSDAGLAALKHLKKIDRLELADMGITDASVEHLKKLSTLKNLIIRNTQITPTGVAEIEKALPQCAVRTR